jgi:glutamate formiminotransferase
MTIDLNHIYITEKSASKTCRLHREIMEGEGEAMEEELGLGGWQPAAGQDIINSTTTTTKISTVGNGLFSMQYSNGAQFLVSEEGNKYS